MVYSERESDARVLLLCAQHASAAACAGRTVAYMRACVFACVLVCVRAVFVCMQCIDSKMNAADCDRFPSDLLH